MPNATAPRAATANHRIARASRGIDPSYVTTCRATNCPVGSDDLASHPWSTAARQGPSPTGAAVTQERADPRLTGDTLSGRVAIVTGGATGLGRAMSLDLAQRGMAIAFNYVNLPGRDVSAQARLTETAIKALGVAVFSEQCDVRQADQVEHFVTETRERLGGVHVLINNAGV